MSRRIGRLIRMNGTTGAHRAKEDLQCFELA